MGAALEDEAYREYVANALYLLITDQRVDKSAKRFGEIVRADEKKDERTGDEILTDIKARLTAMTGRRRAKDGDGH